MAFFFSPLGNAQVIDANGDPLVGGTISTFLAGTTTPVTTYTDDTGGTSQGVVMTLNSLGYPTNGPVWILGGVPLKFIIKNAAGVVQSTFDDVSGIGDTATSADEWVLYGAAPTYISATSFSVAGDQTNTFQVSRRLKSTNAGGTVYSTITVSAFAAGVTTVTVLNTSGVLDAGMSAVSYGLLAAINPSVPAVYAKSGANSDITSLTALTAGGLPALSVLPANLAQKLTLGTAVATTSGTAVDFTGIPSWVKRITILLNGVSFATASNIIVQLGDSGGIEETGYSSTASSGTTVANLSTGFIVEGVASVATGQTGILTIATLGSNLWVQSGNSGLGNATAVNVSAGSKTLSDTLDRIRITGNGATFDAGSVNIIYE